MISELLRALFVAPVIEFERRHTSLHHAVERARRRARRKPVRGAAARDRLRTLIAIVDRGFPGGPNCVRRSLIEIALDRGAANEKLCAGFRAGGGTGSGHAWLQSTVPSERYDAVITI